MVQRITQHSRHAKGQGCDRSGQRPKAIDIAPHAGVGLARMANAMLVIALAGRWSRLYDGTWGATVSMQKAACYLVRFLPAGCGLGLPPLFLAGDNR